MSSTRMLTITLSIAITCLTITSCRQQNKSEISASIVPTQSTATEQTALSQSSQVEVQTDRFSGNVTVTMKKPQTLIDTPERKLTMALKYYLNRHEIAEMPAVTEQCVSITFESSAQLFTRSDNKDGLDFLIDGNPLPVRGTILPYTFSASIDLSKIKKLAAGKKVEMRLGVIELYLTPSTLATIGQFARECTNYAPTPTKRKPFVATGVCSLTERKTLQCHQFV